MEEFIVTVVVLSFVLLVIMAFWRVFLTLRLRRVQDQTRELLERLRDLVNTRFAELDAKIEALQPESARPQPQPPAPEPAAPATPGPEPKPQPAPTAPKPATAAAQAATPPPLAPVPPAPAPARVKSRLEQAAIEALRGVWDWLIVSGKYRPAGVSAEFTVATHWLIRVGILIVVVGVGFFLNYSFEHGWVRPPGRVLLTLLTGGGMIAVGIRLLGKRYHLFGQGLIGGGLAVLYFGFFAASMFYNLIPVLASFACMALVTVGAGIMAVRFNSIMIAILGIVGGYVTPVMLNTGEPFFVGLFSYLLLLGIGILGIAHYRNWLLLNWLGFVGTYGLVLATHAAHSWEGDFWRIMPFLALFFLLYSTLVCIYNLRNRRKSTLIELLGLGLNAGVFFWLSYDLISNAYAKEYVAVVTLVLAAFYVLLIAFFLRRRLADRALLLTLTGLAAFFVSITMPVLLTRDWLTVSWAIQAFIVLWIAAKLDSRFIRHLAYLLYAIVLWRLAFLDLDRAFTIGRRPRTAPVMPLAEYWQVLITRLLRFGVPIASFAGAHRLHLKPVGPGATTVSATNDVREWIKRNIALQVFLWGSLLTGFVYLHFELDRMFLALFEPLRLPILSLLWIGLCSVVLQGYRRQPGKAWLVLLWVAVGGLLLKFAFFDLPSWQAHLPRLAYQAERYLVVEALMRLLDYGLIIAVLTMTACLVRADGNRVRTPRAFALIAGILLFLYLTLEVNTCLGYYVKGFQAGGVTIVWALFALTLLVSGIRRSRRGLRFGGLTLFAVVVLKIFFHDLKDLDQVYKFVAFIALGILVLSGSLIYLRNQHKFATAPKTTKDPTS